MSEIRFSTSALQLQFSSIRGSNRYDPKMISFAAGNPEKAFFPLDKVHDAFQAVLEEDSNDAFQYSGTEGFEELRTLIAEQRMTIAGVDTSLEEIALISGAQQGIDLSARLFVDKGDIIFCEDPSFPGAFNAFRPYGARCIGIPVDEEGMRVDLLEKKLKQYPNAKMIYTIPDFQNPTGTQMSIERRKMLAELGALYKTPIIEDAPYGDIVFEGERFPSIKSFDCKGWVVYLGSFSKILLPGLRIGWIVASSNLLPKYMMAKQNSDLQCGTLAQKLVMQLLKKFDLNEHIDFLKEQYKKRRDAMLKAIHKYLPQNIKYSIPKGGFFIWLELDEKICTKELLHEAVETYRVTFVPGESFFTSGNGKNFLRLSYSSVNEEEIRIGIKRLGKLLLHFD